MIKVLDHVRESLIRSQVDINDIQFGFYAWAQYYRCNISRPTNARKPVYQKEENLICFCWPRKDLWPGALFCPLVGYEEIGNWWMDCKVSESYVWWCKRKSKGKWPFQWDIWRNCWCISRFCFKPANFCHCDGSSVSLASVKLVALGNSYMQMILLSWVII